MRKKSLLITWLKVLTLGCLVSFVLVSVWMGLTVAEINLRIVEKLSLITKTDAQEIVLEQESSILEKDLKSFHLFSSMEGSYEKWLSDLKSQGKIQGDKNLELLEDVTILGARRNDCERAWCFQFLMPFEKIPSLFWKALIGIEDTRFLEHRGVDPKSIARAIIVDIKEMSFVQGGSTLTQQLVKNLFFTNKKSIIRKIKELVVALYVEWKYPKEKILELYFNQVYWGALEGIRIKGLYSASLFYFQKKPSELTNYESTILVSMLKGPSYYSPIKGYKRLRTRVSAVYKRLVDLKYFHAKPADIWDEARWQQWSEGLKNVVNSSLFSKVLLSKKVLGNGLNEYESHVLASRVVELIGSVKKNKKLSKKYDLGIKAVIGRPFSNNATEPSMLFSNRYANTKEALENHKHQIGSTIKPFIYGTLFSLGVKPTDMVETGPITLKLLSGKWSPREAHKNLPEEVTVEYALQHSYNRPVVRLAQKVGMENLEDGLKHYFPDLKSPLAQYPAQLLGAVELNMKGIYQALTHLIKSQCERSKEWEHQNVLNVLADPTLTTISHRVNKGLKELSFFGKTGTTNKGLDNWFVFFDGDIVGAIWVGHLGARDLKGVKLYGSNTSFEIFQQFLMSRGKRYAEFTCPGQAQEQATL